MLAKASRVPPLSNIVDGPDIENWKTPSPLILWEPFPERFLSTLYSWGGLCENTRDNIFSFSFHEENESTVRLFQKNTLYKINLFPILVKILERRNSIEISTPKNPSIGEKKRKENHLSREGRGFQVAG